MWEFGSYKLPSGYKVWQMLTWLSVMGVNSIENMSEMAMVFFNMSLVG